MIFDIPLLETSLVNEVGWQNEDDFYSDVPTLLTPFDVASNSGQYYNRVHPDITLYNVYRTILEDEPSQSQLTNWLVKFNKETVSELLYQIKKRKKLRSETKYLISQDTVFKSGASGEKLEINEGKFVFWKINIAQFENVKVILHDIGLQFTEPVTNLPIYLYHTSQKDAILNETFSTASGFNFEWKSLTDWFIQYNADYDIGGFFLLGYYQDDLANNNNAQAINKTDVSIGFPCETCSYLSSINYARYKEASKFYNIIPCEIENQFLNGIQLPNLGENFKNIRFKFKYKNYGLNLRTSVQSDLTQFILNNRGVLVDALRPLGAYRMMHHFSSSERTNRKESVISNKARIELYKEGESSKLLKEMEDAIDALDFDLSNLNSPSMPEKKKLKFSRKVM